MSSNSGENKVAENKVAENKVAENKVAENKVAENKVAENKVAENKAPDSNATDSSIFNKDNYLDKNTLILTGSFLAIYFIIYAILGIFYDGSDPSHNSSKTTFTNIIILVIIGVIGWVHYNSLTPAQQDTYWPDLLKSVKDYFNNAYSILEVGLFILFLYIGIYFFGIPMTPDDKPWTVSFLESNAFILLFILVFVQFFKYVLKIDIIGLIFGMPDLKTLVSKSPVSDLKLPVSKDEVYNISNNLYSYEDAKAVCKAMGSRLATYDEIEDAYNNGAEWSTYGWSEDQHAYFPTQKDTWAKLQKIKGHEHDLGRPGVNGGYFSNPNVRFGVNCYGVKPPMTDAEKALMDARKEHVYPKSKEDQALDAKVEFWKANRDKMLVINGYNTKAWSRY